MSGAHLINHAACIVDLGRYHLLPTATTSSSLVDVAHGPEDRMQINGKILVFEEPEKLWLAKLALAYFKRSRLTGHPTHIATEMRNESASAERTQRFVLRVLGQVEFNVATAEFCGTTFFRRAAANSYLRKIGVSQAMLAEVMRQITAVLNGFSSISREHVTGATLILVKAIFEGVVANNDPVVVGAKLAAGEAIELETAAPGNY